MSLTVTFTGEEQAAIAAKAATRGMSADELVRQAALDVASKPGVNPRRIEARPEIKRVAMKDRTQEMQWIREHRVEYAGRWVALDGARLVAAGDDGLAVLKAARAAGVPDPLIGHVCPPGPFYGGW